MKKSIKTTSYASIPELFKPNKLAIAMSALLFSGQLIAAEEAPSAEEDSETQENKVVVTAQHREENPQDVPISISLFQEDDLNGMAALNISDLGELTPGVESNNLSFSQPSYNVRGIKTNDFGVGSDPAVAVYVDGVYVGRGGASQANFNDVERVEILKGPQGTLFGRNAAAGAIHVVTKKPEKGTSGNFRISGGDLNLQQFSGVYNTEISDDVYFRASLASITRDGYVPAVGREDLGNIDNQSLRLSMLWDYSESTEVVFRLDYDTVSQDGRPTGTINPAIVSITPDPFGAVETDIDALEDRDMYGFSIEVVSDYGDATLTYIGAYRAFESGNLQEEDGSANDRFFFATKNNEDQEQISHELRLTSNGDDDLQWTVGATYSYEHVKQAHEVFVNTNTLDTFFYLSGGVPPEMIPMMPLGGGLSGFFGSQFTTELNLLSFLTGLPAQTILDNTVAANLNRPWTETTNDDGTFTSIALYGDFTYAATDDLNLTLGLRYTYDSKSFAVQSAWDNSFDIPVPGVAPVPFGLVFFDQFDSQQKDSWTAFTPRVVVDYSLNDNVMLYLSSAKGFKSGGFNSLGVDPAFEEENVTNNEIGFKSDWADGQFIFNFAMYDYEYEDLQILKLTGPAGTIPTYNVGNADAEGNGYDVDMVWQPSENFSLTANYGHVETEYTSYDFTQFPGETAADDVTGEPLSSIPENKWNVILNYNLNMGSAGDIAFRYHHNFTDERVDRSGADPARKIGDYTLQNARITYYPSGADWEISLWGKNLGDEEYLYGIGGQGSAIGSPTATRAMPKTTGIDFRMYF